MQKGGNSRPGRAIRAFGAAGDPVQRCDLSADPVRELNSSAKIRFLEREIADSFP